VVSVDGEILGKRRGNQEDEAKAEVEENNQK
jgi:hypothetical protein